MYRRRLLIIALCTATTTASADKPIDGRPIQTGIGIEVGAIVNAGMSEYGDDYANLAPQAEGLFIRDRNGTSARMVIGLVIAIAGAVAASGPKNIESKSYRSGDYIVTETKTTYYSEEEKAEIRANTNKAIDGLFNARYSDFELHVYSRDRFGRGDTSGYKVNFLVGNGSEKLGFEAGMGFGKADSLVTDASGPTRVRWKYFGMPFRVTGLLGPVRASLTYEWNWLKYGLEDDERFVHTVMDPTTSTEMREVVSGSHPWHVDLSVALLKRVAITGGITAQTLRPELGYYATAGIFF